MTTTTHLWSHLSQFLELEIFRTNLVETIKPQILCSVTFFPTIVFNMG